MQINLWINPFFVGLLILFSLPIKLQYLQNLLEEFLNITFPISLSLYTFFLPPTALLCLFWNRSRITEIWDKHRIPLIVLAFLFCWMWLGSTLSDYPAIALKHSGRYSIMLLTFLALLFALKKNSIKKSSQMVTLIYVSLMVLTFLDYHGQLNIPDLLSNFGLHIDLFSRGNIFPPSSFFENRNPYAVASVGLFFWSLANLRHSLFISIAGIGTALYSIFLAGSRNGIFTLSICLLFLLVLTFNKNRKVHTSFILILTIATVVSLGSYYIFSQTINRIHKYKLNQLWSINSYKDLQKIDIRFTIYRAALESGITNPPILGSGTKTFGHKVFSKAKDVGTLNDPWHKDAFNSHNFLLTVWIEMGWVGLVSVLIFLWLWFRPALRGPPLLMMPMLAVSIGQILDYFVWEILFMAFQSFFFAHFASSIYSQEGRSAIR